MSDRKIHLAHLVSRSGGVSPLCAKTPKHVNLRRESWSLSVKFVTCPDCLVRLFVDGAEAQL